MRNQLTTSVIRSLVPNVFDLTNTAIKILRNCMRAGHQISVQELLDEIEENGLERTIEELSNIEPVKEQHTHQ
jgi:hypothetical protein